jgi:predicted Zn-dependent protease
MGHYQAIVGERSLALEYIDMAVDLDPGNMYVNYTAAIALTTLGDRHRALDTLERALAQGYPGIWRAPMQACVTCAICCVLTHWVGIREPPCHRSSDD